MSEGSLTRREFVNTVGIGLAGLAVTGIAGCAATLKGDLAPKTGRRVVVVGGGWAGATAAKYVRLGDPSIEVILLEPNRQFISCPFSNLVLVGAWSLERLTFGYEGLTRHGVRILHEAATAVEPDRKRVRIGEGYLQYDRLIIAPGIDFQWEQIEGLPEAKETILHAWKAGPQTVALARQLQSMPDGGVFVLTVPPVPYRCPPGPYERASLVAWYLKTHKPHSKLIVLDANNGIVSKAGLFQQAWRDYPNLEYRPTSRIVKLDAKSRSVTTAIGDEVKYDVLNLIPQERAGAIAVQADLVDPDGRWCEVNHVTFESVRQRDVHVVGDATMGLPVPKSGTVANSMGKICAIAAVHLLNGKEPPAIPPLNVCYSWVNDREAIAVINAYRIQGGRCVQIEQRLTPGQSARWGQNAVAWATSIWTDILG